MGGWWDRLKKLIKEDFEEKEIALDVSVDLTPTQQEVYDAVRRMPGATARELGLVYFVYDWRVPGRRLKELVNKGLIEIGERRRNKDTQIEVMTYYPIKSFLEVDKIRRGVYTPMSFGASDPSNINFTDS